MEIRVNRDSVCMGDDIDSHVKVYHLDDNATYEDLFHVLKEDRYFPSIAGNNVVWVLTSTHHECIFSYFTKKDKFSAGLSEKLIRKICEEPYEVHLKYYTHPRKWKEKIYEMHQGDEYAMWRDGWLDEVKYCDKDF